MLAILVKLSYQSGLQTLEILQFRWLTGAAILFFYLFLKDRSLFKANPRTLAKAFILGAIGHGLGSTCFVMGLKYIPASSSSLILYFYPGVVTVVSILFLRMQTSRIVLISLVLVISGCSLIFYDTVMRELDIRGICFSLGAMIICSCLFITKQLFLRNERFLTLTFYMVLFTGLAFLPVHNPLSALDLNGEHLLLILSLGLVPTAIAYVFLFRAIEAVGSAYTSIFLTFEPVTTVVMSFLILGEKIFIYQIIGIGMIILGIILPNLKQAELYRMRRATVGE